MPLPVIAHAAMPFARTGSAVTNVIRHLAREQAALGGRSLVALSDNRKTQVQWADEVFVNHREYCPREWFTPNEMRIDHAAGLLGLDRPYTSRLPLPGIRALASQKPDVVFIHEAHYGLSATRNWRAAMPNAKLYAYLHAAPSRAYTPRELRRLLAPLDGVICVSQFMADLLLRRAGGKTVPLHVVLNGTEAADTHPRVESPTLRVLFYGQVAQHKGPHLLVEAATRLLAKGCDVDFRIIGSSVHGETTDLSGYEKSLRAAADGHADRITFLPFQAREALIEQRHWADVIVIPSVFDDPCPLALLEALTAGRAIVATRRGGIPEIGADAIRYFDPSTPNDLECALRELSSNPQETNDLADAALRRSSELRWSRQYRRLLDAVGVT